jgi:hypothetical protein
MAGLAVVALALSLGASSAQASPLSGAPNCSVFPASNPWNQRVDTLPVASNSAAIIASIGLNTGLHPDFGSGLWNGSPIGIPITVVPGTQTKSKVTFQYASESDAGPYPIPSTVQIEGGSDRHAIIVDRDACKLYELYALQKSGRSWTAGSGAIWSLGSNALRPAGWTSADAAGLPILPGLARYDEVARGVIDHATPLHRRAHAARVRLPRAALRELAHGSEPAADGASRPAQGELRYERLPAPGSRRPRGAQALRDAGRRQRLELVHLGRARRSLEQRRPAHARPGEGLELRGRRQLLARPERLALYRSLSLAGPRLGRALSRPWPARS